MASRQPGERMTRRPTGRAVLAVVALHAAVMAADPAAVVRQLPADRVVVLAADMPGAGDLAVAANGQTVACIDEARRAVVAIDPFDPARRRDVVAAAGDLPEPIAIGWLPGDVLAAVCRSREGWSLRNFRLRPGGAVDAAAFTQSTPLAGDETSHPSVAVSRARNWLAIAGLAGMAPIRGIVAGDGVRLLDEPHAAAKSPAGRAVAVAVSPDDELVVFVKPSSGGVMVSFLGPSGRELLRLDTGLREVRDAAFGRGTGDLFVLAGERGAGDQPEGLWRLDATLREGVQAVQPVCLVALEAPRALASVTERAVVVTHGSGPRRIVRIDPTPEPTPAAGDLAP